MAHAMLTHHCRAHGWQRRVRVESAGTHVAISGQRADARALSVLEKNGIKPGRLRSRALSAGDFDAYDQILVMDRNHLSYIAEHHARPHRAEVRLVMDYAADGGHDAVVPDPYYANEQAFQHTFDLLEQACDGIVQRLLYPRLRLAGTGDS